MVQVFTFGDTLGLLFQGLSFILDLAGPLYPLKPFFDHDTSKVCAGFSCDTKFDSHKACQGCPGSDINLPAAIGNLSRTKKKFRKHYKRTKRVGSE
jgi:hypothetical protein